MQEVFRRIQAGDTDVPEGARLMLEQAMPQIEQADIAIMLAPGDKGHNVNMVAAPFSPTPTLDEVLTGLEPMLRQQFEGMYPGVQFGESGAAKLGSIDALLFPYSYIVNDVTYHQIQYYAFYEDQQYVMTFTWVGPTDEELAQLEAIEAQTVASLVPMPKE